jgi:transposase InsO family protein
MLHYFPFPIKCIQTDRGSEFKLEFEKILKEKNIPHTFTYPNSPEDQPYIERSHRTDEDELYSLYELPEDINQLNKILKSFVHQYNFSRPHQALILDSIPILY